MLFRIVAVTTASDVVEDCSGNNRFRIKNVAVTTASDLSLVCFLCSGNNRFDFCTSSFGATFMFGVSWLSLRLLHGCFQSCLIA